jgi:hypothetical protein
VDVSVWDRCDAGCSPERGFYYHPSRHSAGQPIVAGWAYQFIAQLNFVCESWVAPMNVERLRPAQDANEVAEEQLRAFVRLLHEDEEEQERTAPLFVFDAGYDPVKLQQGLEGCPDPRPFAGRTSLLRRSEPRRSARTHWQATSPRPEDEVQRPKHLARTFRTVRLRGRRLRSGESAGLLEDASEGVRTPRPG